MKFGIFYELQLPRPWGPDDERQLYQNALDQVELADKLGYDYAWEVEHHFLEEYSHSPAPEVFLGAASQRTKNIRLGHGIVQLTTNPPQRVAERIACLDLVSNGRVEMGTGESASITELGGFGRDMETKREVWEDAIRCIMPMFQDRGVELDTKWHKMPMRNVLPKPVQKPHPPLWVACSQLETIEMAGRRGMGALGFQFLSADAAHAWVHAYYNAFTKQQEKLCDYNTNPNIALVSYFMCAETDEEARRRADGATFFQFALRYYGSSSGRKRPDPYTVNMWDEYNKWKRENPEAAARAISGGLIGSPETIAATAAPVRDVQHRPGHPAEPGRQEFASAYLRKPGAVRQGGDAGVPCQRAGAPGMEAQGAGGRDRAGGDRYHAVPRALRSEHGADTGAAGGGVDTPQRPRSGRGRRA